MSQPVDATPALGIDPTTSRHAIEAVARRPTSLELQLFSQIELLAKPSGDFGEPLFAVEIELRPIAD